MTFKKGEAANPGGKPKQKALDDAFRYILSQPLPKTKKDGSYTRIGLPKKPTCAQGAARNVIQSMLDGDTNMTIKLYDRLDGVVPRAGDEGTSAHEPPPPVKSEDVTLKELARVIGSILIQAQPKAGQSKLLANDKR